ncbi:MAG: hypothetical protein A3H51_00465, partial [Candidatus Spechtbacteria bacterium RIFCSPLOWO2_02_FULL_38_8]
GIVEAANEQSALKILQGNNLIVISVSAVESAPLYLKQFKFLQRVSAKDLAIFSRQLATLFAASVPIVPSLYTLAKQVDNTKLQDALLDIAANVDGGMSLDKALEQYPDIFSNFYVQIIRAGEESGTLDKVLNYLADYTEREHRIFSKIRGSMMYPAFIMGVFLIVGTAMLVFVIPQLLSVLSQSGGQLPFITKVIAGASDFIRNQWYLLLAGLVIGLFVVIRFLRTQMGKDAWSRWQLRLPIFGKIFRNIYLFRFTESFGLLIRGGVPINISLEISANVIDNKIYKDIILDAKDKVTKGVPLSSALENYSEVSGMVTQMISVGEKTGKLDSVLENVANFYEQEVSNAIDNLVSLIEPVLIVILGAGVALLVAGILLPIYTSINTLQ